MSRQTLAGSLLAVVAAGLAAEARAQGEGNAPPVITATSWEISRFTKTLGTYWYEPFVPFDPAVELAHERDQVRVTATIVDPDWSGDPDEENEGVFVRQQGVWVPFDGFFVPEPPPITQDDDAFQPEEGDGFAPPAGQTELQQVFEFTVPEFEGKNQARLRGLISYDVEWLMRFMVSNDQDPGCEEGDFGIVRDCEQPVFIWEESLLAIENPALAPPNAPPLADAGADRTVAAGTTVMLDASRTFDAFNLGFDASSEDVFEKDVLSFTWEWISGPARVEPVQDDPSDPIATVKLDVLGEYVYRVTVDDNVNALPSTDSVTITVVQEIPGNAAPSAVVDGPGGPVTVGQIITLDGSASSDPDGDALSYLWRQTDELGGDLPPELFNRVFQPISGRQQAVSTWQAVQPGTFYVRLLVSDGQLTDISGLFSIEVVESLAAGSTAVSDEVGPPPADDGLRSPAAPLPALCGSAALPLALVPLLLWLMRGRIRA